MIRQYIFRLLTLTLISLSNLTASANDLNNIEFQHISTEHGLSQKTVLAIHQDNNGFLWLGTQEGLNRYDGRKLKIFRHSNNDKSSISHDFIRDIVEDKLGNLWVATRGGISRYIQKDESFESIILNENLTPNTIFVDDLGEIWVGTDGGGLYNIDLLEGKYQAKPFNAISELENSDVRAILQDSRDRLWVGTDRNGLFLVNQNTKQHFLHNSEHEKSISHNRIKAIMEDHKGQIWVGTKGGGLNRFNELSKAFEHFKHDKNNYASLGNDRVNKIFEDNNQRLWIATDNGLSIYQPEKNNFIRIQHNPSHSSSLNNDRVLTIFQDNSELVWFGTQSGLNQWNPITAEFVHYRQSDDSSRGLTHNHVHGFAENDQGIIYIATYGGGLNYFDPITNKFDSISKKLPNENATSDLYLTTLMVDKKNQLWVGTLSHGVDVFSEERIKLTSFKKDKNNLKSLSANGITDILQDSDGEIWISTYRAGLNRQLKDGTGFHHYQISDKKDALTNEYIFQVIQDDEGYIWITTDGGGIFRLDKNTNIFKNFTHEKNNLQSLSGTITTTIFQDSKGRFWIGTQGSGLNRWEPEHRRRGINLFQHYSVENGLNSSTINGVLEDETGNIWISTNRGVSRLNPDTDKIKHYNLADEVHGNELNHAAVLRSKKGRLYFGGLEGISAFYPADIKQNNHLPNVVLTKIQSEGRELNIKVPLSELNTISFDHKDYLITFEFAGLDFSQPSKNQYQYKLEGLDSDWVNIGNLNRATFTNLPAGTYTLKVKGSNNDSVWSDESVNLKVTVQPAPWASWWAYSLYIATFSLLLLLIIRSQAKRLANQEMFKNQVSEQVDEKTALYVKNNEFLNEQMEQLKFYANVDLDTGLPNQKYLCDLVKANIQWVNQFEGNSNENTPKLCVGLLRLPAMGNFIAADADGIVNKIAKLFSERVSKLEADFKVLVRWGERELGVVYYSNNEAESERFIGILSTQFSDVLNEILKLDAAKYPVKIGYTLFPFSGTTQPEIDSVNLLMLTEHLLHLVINSPDKNVVGITGANQRINSAKFRQIMSANQLKELGDLLVFASN